MATPNNLNQFLEKLYGALSSVDVETWGSMHEDSVIFNVNGDTRVSGRILGKQALLGDILPRLFTKVNPETARIGINWRLMCADQNRAVVIFEGESETLQGESYNNRYVQIMQFSNNGLIEEVWEFFDTALAEERLFSDGESFAPTAEAFTY